MWAKMCLLNVDQVVGLNMDKEACLIVFLYESFSTEGIEDDSSCLSWDNDWSCGGGYDKFQWGQDFDLEIIIVRWGTMLWGRCRGENTMVTRV